MLVVYQKIPADEIRKEAKDIIVKIGDWFKANPKRRVCNAELWYNKPVKIRRKSIIADIEQAVKEAIG